MRTIKFRGKRKDNGEWVYGAYFNLHHNDGREHIHHFIIPDDTDLSYGTLVENIQVEIVPKSLGQFTGLADCNGNGIYEGDIVEYYDDIEDEMRSGVVRYYDDYCSFNIDDEERDPISLNKTWTFKVINNIHEGKWE